MTDIPATTATPAALDYNFVIELPKRDGEENGPSVTIDAAAIPAATRLAILRRGISDIIKNRVAVAENRVNKSRAPFANWARWQAYNAAVAADPLQTAVPKPDGEAMTAAPEGTLPDLLDRVAKGNEGVKDLLEGKLQSERTGTSRDRTPVDPLVKAITGVVTQAVFASHQQAGTTIPVEGKPARKYSYPDAVKEVGRDGLAYLNAQIAAKVAAAPEGERAALQASLEKSRDARYVNPARVLTGADAPGGKGNVGLPSIL